MAIWVRFVCFVGFEMTVNMYFPAMFMMKSSVVPSESRTAVYSVYRVPLNLAVICVLMSDLPVKGSLQAASAMLFGAAVSAHANPTTQNTIMQMRLLSQSDHLILMCECRCTTDPSTCDLLSDREQNKERLSMDNE